MNAGNSTLEVNAWRAAMEIRLLLIFLFFFFKVFQFLRFGGQIHMLQSKHVSKLNINNTDSF